MQSRYRITRKAPLVGAFFVLGLWLQPGLAGSCDLPADAAPVKIRHVHDGDTLTLTDGTRVRLIGINTPELGRDGRPNEPLAIEARDTLRRLLFQSGNHAELRAGRQPRDKHKRQLANLWLPDGRNLSASLLADGLGWPVAIPPNVDFIDCYTAATAKARAARKGVWQKPAYQAMESSRLGLRDTGFKRVVGRVNRVNHGGGATWLNLDGRFAIRIPDKSRRWFPQLPDRGWIGQRLEVSGWVYQVRGELRVNVDHPAMLQLQPGN